MTLHKPHRCISPSWLRASKPRVFTSGMHRADQRPEGMKWEGLGRASCRSLTLRSWCAVKNPAGPPPTTHTLGAGCDTLLEAVATVRAHRIPAADRSRGVAADRQAHQGPLNIVNRISKYEFRTRSYTSIVPAAQRHTQEVVLIGTST